MQEQHLIEFEWSFTPPALFEEVVELFWSGRTFAIDAGRVRLRTEVEGGQTEWQALANELHNVLLVHFLAAQILSHEPFSLSKPRWARIRPDGGRDFFVTLEGGRIHVTAGVIDVMHTSASGEVLHDSRRQRNERRRIFAQTAAKYAGDQVLDSILRSYSAAVNDPANELIHLYEIRDAVAKYFQGEHPARKALGVSGAAWSTLGRLADGEPLWEGRHRGQFAGTLRSATGEELQEARRIARTMIEGYVAHLEASGGTR